MLSPWLVDILAQAVLFVLSCSCCGGKRKHPQPNFERPRLENQHRNIYSEIPVADTLEEEPNDWDLVEAEEADLFGLQVRSERMHY